MAFDSPSRDKRMVSTKAIVKPSIERLCFSNKNLSPTWININCKFLYRYEVNHPVQLDITFDFKTKLYQKTKLKLIK